MKEDWETHPDRYFGVALFARGLVFPEGTRNVWKDNYDYWVSQGCLPKGIEIIYVPKRWVASWLDPRCAARRIWRDRSWIKNQPGESENATP